MTYQQLLAQLKVMNEEQLNMDVTVYVCDNDEYYAIQDDIVFATEECGVLDVDHPVLYL
jgi:hypothetical protein